MLPAEEGSVVNAYVEDIERLVAEDFLTDALEKLLDFVRDFAPDLKKAALALYARHSRVRKGLKQRTDEKHALDEARALDDIVGEMLAMAEQVRVIATEAAANGTSPLQAAKPQSQAEGPSPIGEPQLDGATPESDVGYT